MYPKSTMFYKKKQKQKIPRRPYLVSSGIFNRLFGPELMQIIKSKHLWLRNPSPIGYILRQITQTTAASVSWGKILANSSMAMMITRENRCVAINGMPDQELVLTKHGCCCYRLMSTYFKTFSSITFKIFKNVSC